MDAGAILAIVLLNGLLGFIQENQAERSLAALHKLSLATARAIREGESVRFRPGNRSGAMSC